MKNVCLSLVLCSLLFSPIHTSTAVAASDSCQAGMASKPETTSPASHKYRWIAGAGGLCALVVGGVAACRVEYSEKFVEAGYLMLMLTSANVLWSTAKRFILPQVDWTDQNLNRFGKGTNQWITQWLLGKTPTISVFGDTSTPDYANAVESFRTFRQQVTADKLDSDATHLDWLGYLVPQYLEEGKIDFAASEFVTNVVHMAFDTHDVLLQVKHTSDTHIANQLMKLALYGYLINKIKVLISADQTLVARFEAAAQKASNDLRKVAPDVFQQYEQSIDLILNQWMGTAFASVGDYKWHIDIKEP